MKHRRNSKRYNDDFRKMIVDLYHSGQRVKDLSKKYGVSEVIIDRWIKSSRIRRWIVSNTRGLCQVAKASGKIAGRK